MVKKKILVLCPYPEGVAAGQRLKYEQYIPDWRNQGYTVTVSHFSDLAFWNVLYKPKNIHLKMLGAIRGYLRRIYDLIRVRSFDLVYIFMWVTPRGTTFFERIVRLLSRRIIYDFDDSIFLENCKQPSALSMIVNLLKSGNRCRYLIKNSDQVVISSPFHEGYCKDLNKRKACVYIPCSLDTDRFIPSGEVLRHKKITIGWTGTFGSVPYLNLLKNVFMQLSEVCEYKLRIIGNFDYNLPGIDLEVIQWTKENEIEDLRVIDIGIYPLVKDEWTLGKGALKAMQYMAMGIPCVATNHGTTAKVIKHLHNGWLVDNDNEWLIALQTLINDSKERKRLGESGRETVVKNYSTNVIKHNYRKVIKSTLNYG